MNRVLELEMKEFQDRTGMDFGGDELHIVSLRDLDNVKNIELMPTKTLETLLRNVPIGQGSSIKPYKDSVIALYDFDPNCLYIGQRFAEKDKIFNTLSIAEQFSEFPTPGIAQLPPLIVHGESGADKVVAFYMPPIIESFDGSFLIIDGIHRSYAARGMGTTMKYVTIKKQPNDFPIRPTEWDQLTVVKDKPPKSERFFDLKPEYFRRLDYVGIDG